MPKLYGFWSDAAPILPGKELWELRVRVWAPVSVLDVSGVFILCIYMHGAPGAEP